ncbi:amidase family protein [Vagococcus fluvialis]|uniref:amidase family protein n=1 Tax=Vagococcus fluvialis TaxID=2738 RepID=UPI0014329485|nr:amidase family protein [Vagococcus fluvialis]MBO0487482.1 LPXTG cell wall anchor domain-containing protein [Vagococcus fluvialis]NKC58578.1 LPXTG cell wall anchor domain-containing protein [Vagococcus fluvialis]NKD49190.1 LPXTG cell wall anchor domain-containing protein [Vagococcus fluvialis]
MSWFKKTSWKLVLLALFLLPITGFADEVVIDYKNMSATELAEMVRNKEVTSEYLVQEAYKVIKEENPKLNAVIGLREAEALEEARNIEDTGQPFLGVPILVKGLGHTVKGMPNSNGFPFAKDQLAGSNGSFVKALQSAGFIVLGQTNYPEMGWRNITDSALYGPTGSPWNPSYQAGGSSGGAGASVASGMNPIASGSDAGGSIRIPASWNGIVGLKPSRGVIKANSTSNKGQVVHFANTRDMKDTKLLFEALRNEKVSIKDTAFSKDLKIAYSTESPVGTPVTQDAIDAVNQAVAFLRSQGFDVVEAKPEINGIKLMENYYTIAAGSAGVAEYLGNQILKRPITIEDVDILTWALYQTGKVTSKEEVNEAWDFSHEAQAVMENFHQSYPIYLTPTTASTAPLVGDPLITPENLKKMSEIDQMEAPDRKKLIYDQWLDALTYTPYTQLANLTGEPALSLPTFVSSNGLPLGIQLNAATGEDRLLLEFGQLFEDNKQFKLLKQEEEVPEESTDSSSSESEVPEESTDSSLNESGSVEESSNSSTKESSEKDTTPSSSKEEIKKTDSTNNSHNQQKKRLESSNTSSPSTQSLPKTGEKKIVLLPVIGVILLVLLGIIVLFKKKNK